MKEMTPIIWRGFRLSISTLALFFVLSFLAQHTAASAAGVVDWKDITGGSTVPSAAKTRRLGWIERMLQRIPTTATGPVDISSLGPPDSSSSTSDNGVTTSVGVTPSETGGRSNGDDDDDSKDEERRKLFLFPCLCMQATTRAHQTFYHLYAHSACLVITIFREPYQKPHQTSY